MGTESKPEQNAPSTRTNPAAKSLWQQGLNPKDLAILRHKTPKKLVVGPVVLATLASHLARQYGRKTPPQRYFNAAYELLRLADHFLSEANKAVVVEQLERVDQLELGSYEGYIPVKQALAVIDKGNAKKGRSRLGGITTRDGLKKALKRLFREEAEGKIVLRSFETGEGTVEKEAIHCETVKCIRDDEERANKARGVKARGDVRTVTEKPASSAKAKPTGTAGVAPVLENNFQKSTASRSRRT